MFSRSSWGGHVPAAEVFVVELPISCGAIWLSSRRKHGTRERRARRQSGGKLNVVVLIYIVHSPFCSISSYSLVACGCFSS